MITERDMKILSFIDRFQFTKRRFIKELYFSSNTEKGACKASYDRINKLKKAGLIKKIDDLWSREHIYLLTFKGAQSLTMYGEKPTVHKTIAWNNFMHNEMIQRVLMEFVVLGHRRFMSERDFIRFTKKSELIPDLVLVKDDDRFIYIEIELEEKSVSRLTDRAQRLTLEPNLAGVLYVCGSPRIENKVNRAYLESSKKINFFCIEESHFFKNAKTFCKEILHA